ncbi:MAG: hypothetical protein LIO97_12155 [Tannerellaceae bacterium]|nr:hypothetical protein [Tannerellaceae bacterium]
MSEWFYKCIRGIRPALDTVGFDKIVVRPDYIGQLKWANTSYQSVHGKISTAWKHDKKTFELTVTIPDGCSAEVYVPVSKSKKIKENGSGKAPEAIVTTLNDKIDYAVFQVGPGSYHYISSLR